MSKLKWFLGEFFVVVAGVLVAFVLNGWWLQLKTLEKERNYLKLIHADLNSTIDAVASSRDEQHKIVLAASNVLTSAYSAAPLDEQALKKNIMRSMSFSPSKSVSATLSSLVSTGDLGLISNDSLRSSFGALLSSMESYQNSNENLSVHWLIPAYDEFADALVLSDSRYRLISFDIVAQLSTDSMSGFVHPDELRPVEAVDLSGLVERVDFKQALTKLHIAQSNFFALHEDFHRDLVDARETLEAVMREMDLEVPSK